MDRIEQERVRQLEHRLRLLEFKNSLLEEAIETICCAFLNNSKGLDTAIQSALQLRQKAQDEQEESDIFRKR